MEILENLYLPFFFLSNRKKKEKKRKIRETNLNSNLKKKDKTRDLVMSSNRVTGTENTVKEKRT